MKTPQRPFRVKDWPYHAALDRARREGTTLTARVTEWLERYARGEDWK